MQVLDAFEAALIGVGGAPRHEQGRRTAPGVGTVAVLEGPAPATAAVADLLARRLPGAPRLRRRPMPVPFGLGRPVWADDPRFDVGAHVRRVAVPAPGGPAQLAGVVSGIIGRPFPTGRPPWEVSVVEGVAGGQWALVSRAHVALLDGRAGHDPIVVMAGDQPTVDLGDAPRWVPEPTPSAVDLMATALAARVFDPFLAFRLGGRAVLAPYRGLARLAEMAVDRAMTWSFGGQAVPRPPTAPGSGRAWKQAEVDLALLRRIGAAHGAAVHDVVLTLVAAGVRRMLRAAGEPVAGRMAQALVPVSIARAGLPAGRGPGVEPVWVNLPLGLSDHSDALEAVAAQTADLRRSGRARGGAELANIAGFAAPDLVVAGLRIVPTRAGGPVLGPRLDAVVLNAPGPQHAAFVGERRVLAAWPMVPVSGQLGLGLAAYSYLGSVYLGVSADGDAERAAAVVAGAEEAAAQLARRGAGSRPAGGPPEPAR